MNQTSSKIQQEAILVVSFGTSYEETCQKTIGAIEDAIRSAFPDKPLYRAWTSKRIIKKLKITKNIHVDTVSEALHRMLNDGITNIIVQPTHVINGIETNLLMEDIQKHGSQFQSINLGTPLLTSMDDCNAVADILSNFAEKNDDDHLYVLMGHGTEHHADKIYQTINDLLIQKGRSDIVIGTVEGKFQISDVVDYASTQNTRNATLLPFMIVAGDHANNDMAGDDDDSWKNILAQNDISSSVILKGLGEYPEIRELFIDHCRNAKEFI
ncbi:MAG: sirohydrochlorin cobaltochelatase [Eubacteriales bacterium]|nr:sirohydrochlorin cobaltochelatase [Eubacteriales bacterium]